MRTGDLQGPLFSLLISCAYGFAGCPLSLLYLPLCSIHAIRRIAGYVDVARVAFSQPHIRRGDVEVELAQSE